MEGEENVRKARALDFGFSWRGALFGILWSFGGLICVFVLILLDLHWVLFGLFAIATITFIFRRVGTAPAIAFGIGLVLFPVVMLPLGAIDRYLRGTTELPGSCYIDLDRPERICFDPKYKVHRGYRNAPYGQGINAWSLRLSTFIVETSISRFGPMKGSYEGDYVPRDEAYTLLQTKNSVRTLEDADPTVYNLAGVRLCELWNNILYRLEYYSEWVGKKIPEGPLEECAEGWSLFFYREGDLLIVGQGWPHDDGRDVLIIVLIDMPTESLVDLYIFDRPR